MTSSGPGQAVAPAGLVNPAPVVLCTERVRLEPLAEEHWPGVLAALRHPELWMYGPTPMRTAQDARSYLDKALEGQAAGRLLAFAVLVRSAEAGWVFAGSTRIAIVAPEHQRVEIGWTWLLPEFQRTGVNREAKLLLLTHCFERLGCERVEFKGHAANAKSRSALAGIGATFEGIHRRHLAMPDGSWRDSFYFSVIAPEWADVKRQLTAALAR